MAHKSGFVNIIGSPNVGKSTLMNELVGERLSIITSKAQTTRHRILGIVNEDEYQICFSDTPGVLVPSYKLQEGMMQFVDSALKDADLFLFVTDFFEDECGLVWGGIPSFVHARNRSETEKYKEKIKTISSKLKKV